MRLTSAIRGVRPVFAAAIVALLVGAGGFAYAQSKIKGKDIAANAIKTKHVKNKTITPSKLRKGLRQKIKQAPEPLPDTVGHLIHVDDGTEQMAHLTYTLNEPVALEDLDELTFFQELVHGTGNFGANVNLGVDVDGGGYDADDLAWHIGATQHDPAVLGGDTFVAMDGLNPSTDAKVDAPEVEQWWTPNAAGDGPAGGAGCEYNQTLADFVANCANGRFDPGSEVHVIRLVLGGSSSWNDIAVRLTTSIDGELTSGLFE